MKESSSENTCKMFAENISAYVDGQLTGELLEAVEKHLRQCPHCARQLENYMLFKNLINTERQNCPVDLTSVVMAGLERDHLLQGLETFSKPPTPRWIKLVRALSAAAMLALIASAGLIIMHFTASTPEPARSTVRIPLPATRDLEVKEKNVPPQRQFAYDDQAKQDQYKASGPSQRQPGIAGKLNDTLESKPLPPAAQTRNRPFFSEPAISSKTAGRFAKEISSTASAPANKMPHLWPQAPLALRPSPVSPTSERAFMPVAQKSGDLAWPVEVVYQLYSSDLPGWMLTKEQVIIALMENDIPTLSESYQVAEALEDNEEFFYLAKKGLDLPPGSRSAQILLVTEPQTFAKIHASLQQAMSDATRQKFSPELEAFLKSQMIAPELAARTQSSFAALDSIFGVTKVRPIPTTTQATQTTTTAAVSTSSAPTSLPAASAPATAPVRAVSTRPNLPLLAVLIKIEIGRPTPTTTTATAPTTQTTQP